MSDRVFVIIPAFNEGDRIESVLREVLRYTPHVVVVDDGSQDSNLQQLKVLFPQIFFIRHSINLGKGAAMKTGCEVALQNGADILMMMDADGQHEASDIPRFIEKFNDGKIDIVFGARTIGKDMPLLLFLGNKFLSICVNLLFRIFISDTQSGFRAFRASVYKDIEWMSQDYSVETEMIANAAKHHLKYAEVDIQTIYHDKYKGTTPLDGIKIFFQILKWRLV